MGLKELAERQQMRRGTGYFVKEWEKQMNRLLQELEDATIQAFNDPSEYTMALRDNAYLEACRGCGKDKADTRVATTLCALKNRQPA